MNRIIVALMYRRNNFGLYEPNIDLGILDSGNTIIDPSTLYNARISPERNAIRHSERLFFANSPKNTLEFTSGTGNVTALGRVFQSSGAFRYLEDSANGQIIKENQTITKSESMRLKPEILSFEYPFTFDNYAAIMANPYGIIIVDGEECYTTLGYKLSYHTIEN